MGTASTTTLVDATTIEVDPLNANFNSLKNACNNIIADQITDGVITNAKLVDGTIEADKIKDGTITNAKLSGGGTIPIGSIIAYGSETEPTGWIECDGSSLLREGIYADLFEAIGLVYGYVDATHFDIPNLQGKFLRGWDNSAGNDPDAATRTAQDAAGANNGVTGDNVGSVQADAFKAHTHTTVINKNADLSYGGDGATPRSNGSEATGSTGGSETRPINVNAMYIIKYA